jgi:hypothetical protein
MCSSIFAVCVKADGLDHSESIEINLVNNPVSGSEARPGTACGAERASSGGMVPEQEGPDEAQANGGGLRTAPPLVRSPHRRERAPHARPRRAPGGVRWEASGPGPGQRRLPLVLRRQEDYRERLITTTCTRAWNSSQSFVSISPPFFPCVSRKAGHYDCLF